MTFFAVSMTDIHRRTMFWEDGLLTCACDWTKAQALTAPDKRRLMRVMVKTCTPRTSQIFIRCALVTKSAEARIVKAKFGAEAAAVHWASFAARKGDSMCTQTNYMWALNLLNKPALKFDTVHPRSRRIAAEEAEQHGASNTDKRRLLAASAMMFNHSLETEDMVYAGDDFGTWV